MVGCVNKMGVILVESLLGNYHGAAIWGCF
jgi:hypothetical protein